MQAEIRALLSMPVAARAPRAAFVWDRVVAAGFVVLACVEGLLRPGLEHRPAQVAVGIVFAATVAFRNVWPLAATATGFGLYALLTLVENAFGLPKLEMWMTACSLLLPYTLVRRGSGRDILVGHVVFVGSSYVVAALCGEMANLTDYIGGAVVMLFPSALGAAVRFRAEAHRRDIEHAKLRERADIARDLHDSVAHHISAIVIQAQAGKAVIAARPEAAATALATIEAEAVRTLSELRGMVRTLREDHGGLAPQLGASDIPRLAQSSDAITVDLAPELASLAPSLQSALYRLTQESITNALRHARGFTRVTVRIAVDGPSVRLTVRDDGAPSRGRGGSGFGLVGMAERAALLGGTLEAGPHDDGGWRVEAILPRSGESR